MFDLTLTFDNSPEPETAPFVLDVLARRSIRTTLFVVGNKLSTGTSTLHLPMVPELPITMLACARLGVIHSQVFSGFSGKATADRIADSESRVLITMDAYRSCSRFRKICCKDATRKIHLSKQPAAENISVLIGIRWHGEGANRKGAARFGLRRVQTNISGHFCHGISYSAFAATV
jgi:acyl-coenzyme A synthetase/AMP-(fatty) acid ligase